MQFTAFLLAKVVGACMQHNATIKDRDKRFFKDATIMMLLSNDDEDNVTIALNPSHFFKLFLI